MNKHNDPAKPSKEFVARLRKQFIEAAPGGTAALGMTIDEVFRETDARLHYYTERGYGWIELGGFRLYFLGDEEREKAEVNDGGKVTKVSVKYDGWELG